jgi:hypothetical protein
MWKFIADVKTAWTLAAFAIAGLVALYTKFATKPGGEMRKALSIVTIAVCVVAFVPIIAASIHDRDADPALAIYRVRVLVLDPDGVPSPGAAVKTTTSNEAKTNPDGSAEFAIPKGSLQQDGKISIIADQGYLHARRDLTLGSDLNRSVTLTLASRQTADLIGTVEDEKNHAIAGARVSVAGAGGVNTDQDGTFKFLKQFSPKQLVTIHVEKAGYDAVDQDHPAGPDPAVIVLPHARRRR